MYQGFDAMLKSQGITGFNGDDLMKALYSTNSGPGGIQQGPLTLENLDGVMTEVLVTQQHFKIMGLIPIVPSANAYYEFNKHSGFGSRRAGLGFAEGGGPTGGVSSFIRSGEYVKYLGVRGGVTDQMLRAGQAGGIFEDPTNRENKDRTLELLERFEREAVFGDKRVTDKNGVEVNFDGLLTQLMSKNSSNVVDMKGKAFGFDNLDNSSENLITAGKQATMDGYTCLMSPHVAKGINKQYADRNIVRLNKDQGSGAQAIPGFKVPAYDGQFGSIGFDHSILLQEVETAAPAAAAPSGAPAQPSWTSGSQPATSGSVGPAAGTYTYAISAFNDTGESLPSSDSNTVALNGSQGATMTIVPVTGATGYRIYRKGATAGSPYKLIDKIMAPAVGTTATYTTPMGNTANTATASTGNVVFVDTGAWQPYDYATPTLQTDGLAILIKPEPRDLCIAQLAPLHKKVLPALDTLNPFLLMLYVTLVLKAPERIRIYKNCGTYVDGTNLDTTK